MGSALSSSVAPSPLTDLTEHCVSPNSTAKPESYAAQSYSLAITCFLVWPASVGMISERTRIPRNGDQSDMSLPSRTYPLSMVRRIKICPSSSKDRTLSGAA